MILLILLISNICISGVILTATDSICIPINKCKEYESKFDRVMDGVASANEISKISCGFDYSKYVHKGNNK